MLIQPDSSNLGDKKLNPEEALAKSKEDTRRMQQAKGLLLYKQEELEDASRGDGPKLYYKELIQRLEKLNPQLLIRDGAPGNIAVYVLKTREQREADGNDPNAPDWYNDHKYVTGFPCDWISEYSTITVDERGLPKRHQRGWRSILIDLIKAHGITYSNAVKEFGEPTGERSWRWNDQLRDRKG